MLEGYVDPAPLEEEKTKALREIVMEAEEELGVAEFWKGKEHLRSIGTGEFKEGPQRD